MVTWVGSRFVQEADGLSVQRHEVAFEAEIVHMCHVLIAIRVVVFDEQVD